RPAVAVGPRRRVVPGAALPIGREVLRRPHRTGPAAGHERGGAPRGTVGQRHGRGTGRGRVQRRRARLGVGGTQRQGRAGTRHRRRLRPGPGTGHRRTVRRRPDRGARRRPGTRRAAAPVIVAGHDLTRTYQLDGLAVEALRGVTLKVAPGDYVSIVGRSGSGKSTLMHLLGGLDRPTSGRLLINGEDVAALSASEMARLRNTTIGFV